MASPTGDLNMFDQLRGREARAASGSWNVCKTLLQTVVFWSVFLSLLPWVVINLERLAAPNLPPPATSAKVIGGVLFLVAGSLSLTSGLVMALRGRGTPMPNDCPRELVVAGPYRYVRNPMAVGGITQGVAVGLMLGSPFVVIYSVAGAIVWHLLVRPWEEADLERRFGQPYLRYRATVRCWIPRCTPYVPISIVVAQDTGC